METQFTRSTLHSGWVALVRSPTITLLLIASKAITYKGSGAETPKPLRCPIV